MIWDRWREAAAGPLLYGLTLRSGAESYEGRADQPAPPRPGMAPHHFVHEGGQATTSALSWTLRPATGTVEVVGNVEITGDVQVSGDVSAGGVSLRSHRHTGVQPGAALTESPAPAP